MRRNVRAREALVVLVCAIAVKAAFAWATAWPASIKLAACFAVLCCTAYAAVRAMDNRCVRCERQPQDRRPDEEFVFAACHTTSLSLKCVNASRALPRSSTNRRAHFWPPRRRSAATWFVSTHSLTARRLVARSLHWRAWRARAARHVPHAQRMLGRCSLLRGTRRAPRVRLSTSVSKRLVRRCTRSLGGSVHDRPLLHSTACRQL